VDPSEHLTSLETEASRFFEVAAGSDLELPVPACPKWSIGNLLAHMGDVHRWTARIVSTGQRVGGSARFEPPEGEGVLAWGRSGYDEMIDAMRGKDPLEPCWTFGRSSPQNVGWWYRRQALELAVHRFDIESAAQRRAGPVEPRLAADGVDEFMFDMFPMLRERVASGGLEGTLHLHATDAAGEWLVDFDAADLPARREHAKADTALRGPASGLFLWLWNRQTTEQGGLEAFGSQTVLEAWTAVRI